MTSSQRQKSGKPTPEGVGVYSLEFVPIAKKELEQLEKAVLLQLLKKLRSRTLAPRVQADKLRGMPDCYKIKLKASGVRLVYEVIDHRVVIVVVAVGRRDDEAVYRAAMRRLGKR